MTCSSNQRHGVTNHDRGNTLRVMKNDDLGESIYNMYGRLLELKGKIVALCESMSSSIESYETTH